MEIKDTLLMPKTSFEMRGNLPNKEPGIRKSWEENKVYKKMVEKNKGKETFILHDGPPYANGDMHMGHALNKSLKDFIIRYKAMSGYYTPFTPGWDTHGLPIENALIKSGVNRKTTPVVEFRNKCEEYANKQVLRQMEQQKALGLLADYDDPYLTLHRSFEANEVDIFATLALKGIIYRGKKPVYWSPSSESALAEAEVEYYDKEDTSIYVKFRVKDGLGVLDNDTYFVIWTTTPWTIPSNLAICLNENLEYGLFETSNQGKLVFLTSLESELTKAFALEDVKLVKTFKGKELEYIKASHPLYERDSLVILGNHVTSDAGTGCVHTAPGLGADDFFVGQKYGLDILSPVDDRGCMTSEVGSELEGLFYTEANEKVIEMLTAREVLLRKDRFTHSYPHDWRTKKPIIFRSTPQWFASIDKIRNELLSELDNVKFYNPWGHIRMTNMIKDRGDWCISRQRLWGLPIPIIYNEDGSPILDKEVFAHISNLFREKGSTCWYELDALELLPKGYTNPLSPNNKFTKEKDTLDVWFDSGSSHTGVLKEKNQGYPADLYLEGSDQYRGWFNSSLILGVSVHGKRPYKNLVSHGFVVDGKGLKMSKSSGNGVDPNKVISVQGADVLRLWAASIDYQADCKVGDDILKQVSESYRKIRNTCRFLVGNLSNGSYGTFDPNKDKVDSYELVDLCILERLQELVNKYVNAMDNYDFLTATSEILNFMSVDLSSFYLDLSKDVLYCETYSSLRRKQIQNVLYKVLETLIRLLTPFIPHTMDELYRSYMGEGASSTALLEMPKVKEVNNELLNEYKRLLVLRSDVLKAIEEKRNEGVVKSSQEVSLEIDVKDEETKKTFDKLSNIEKTRLFIVSEVKETSLSGFDKEVSRVRVSYHNGEKCERCWNKFDASLISNCMCPRCNNAFSFYKGLNNEE